MRNISTKKGIALLMSVLTVSVILSVGLTIVGAVIKQLNISSSFNNSVIAVYMADTGIECAMLWDIRGHEPAPFLSRLVIPSTTNDPHPVAGSNVDCFDEDLSSTWAVDRTVANVVVTTFNLETPAGDGCAEVEITKTLVAATENTSILSRGYNTACADIGTNVTAVERAIKVDYIF